MTQQHYDVAVAASKMKSPTDKREEREKQQRARYRMRLEFQRGSGGMNFAFYRCGPDDKCKTANEHFHA